MRCREGFQKEGKLRIKVSFLSFHIQVGSGSCKMTFQCDQTLLRSRIHSCIEDRCSQRAGSQAWRITRIVKFRVGQITFLETLKRPGHDGISYRFQHQSYMFDIGKRYLAGAPRTAAIFCGFHTDKQQEPITLKMPTPLILFYYSLSSNSQRILQNLLKISLVPPILRVLISFYRSMPILLMRLRLVVHF